MIRVMHGVLVTPTFERQAAEAGLSEEDILQIATWLARHPTGGSLMAGTGGARKVRFARQGKGKSGGFRTIHYYAGEDVLLFLLVLVDKSERANLSKAERNELAKILPRIAEAYRAGRLANAAKMMRTP